MYALDFEYGDFSTGSTNDKAKLSDFGFIVCQFDATGGANVVNAGSTITFNKTPINYGKRFGLVSTSYDECLETTFDICKNPDTTADSEITEAEQRKIMFWLNRREFLDFRIIYENNYHSTVYYKASFNIDEIRIAEKLYGFRLTMTTDKPYGYGEKVTATYTDYIRNTHKYYDNDSDTMESIPFNVTFTSNVSGEVDITLRDYTSGAEYSRTKIYNCSIGETITIDSENQIITTDSTTHKIYNDFNYVFPKLMRTWNSSHPTYTRIRLDFTSATYPYTATGTIVGTFTVSYTPIKKGSIS